MTEINTLSGASSRQGLGANSRASVEVKNVRAKDTPKAPQVREDATPKLDVKQLQLGAEEVSRAIQALNDQLRSKNSSLSFEVDESLGRAVITVKNSHSGEVIRQIPDESVVAFVKNLEKMTGKLISKSV